MSLLPVTVAVARGSARSNIAAPGVARVHNPGIRGRRDAPRSIVLSVNVIPAVSHATQEQVACQFEGPANSRRCKTMEGFRDSLSTNS